MGHQLQQQCQMLQQELHLLLQEEDMIRDNPNNNQFNHNKVEHHLFKELINSKPGTMFMILSYLSSLLSLVFYFIGDLLFQWTYLRTQHLNLVISEQNFKKVIGSILTFI